MENTAPGTQVLSDMSMAEYDQIIGQIYDSAFDTRRLVLALRQIRRLFKANFVALILRSPDEGHISPMIVAGNVDGEGEITDYTYYHDSEPFCSLPIDQVFTIEDIMSESEWTRTAYYLFNCCPYDAYHLLGVDISTPDGGKLRFRISRPESDPKFSASARAMCKALVPHLRRALHMHFFLDRSESLGNLYSQAVSRLSVATLLLDKNGRVLQFNPVAREILDSNDGVKLVGGRLEATYPSDNRELQRLVRRALSRHGQDGTSVAEAISISRPSGRVSLGVVVEPIPSHELLMDGKGQPAAVVYIRDAVGKSLVSSAMIKQLYNLTPAETCLALELANGLSLEEAAELLNIRHNTARAHLRAIFSKTGVRRQTELVRIMLNSVVALGG
ncbi:helix-turn-helix transcriptional regulator [Pseudomonas sp. MBLB4136]|uniref:helix-turn-helix transcriptional regulator n=1 Tax=Pseudomonas sp. MBLB4136 TaxID=3451558 RepID=UPI003F752D1B